MRRKNLLAPSDYLSRETGGLKKRWKGRLPVALLFPNTYHVGMSNLGLQLVYELVNRDPEIVCERVFYPETSISPLSIESNRPLGDFPIILCSISFEQDFVNLVKILHLAGISSLASARDAENQRFVAGSPLVVGGGVATFINPEPLAPYIDLFVVGEAEPVLPDLMAYLKDGLVEKRKNVLRELARTLPGCYVPRFYVPHYHDDGTLDTMSVEKGILHRIKKVVGARMEKAGHSHILSPDAEFADLYLAELGRGCSRGCRFCAAGFVYRPPRLWSVDAIIAAFAERPSGTRRIGLLGMEMARAGDLAELANHLLHESCTLSFSSLRADCVSRELLELLGKSGLKTAAIAPDGGSERLRRVINKGLSENDILSAAESLVQVGVRNLKLYFMIGLPTESMEDIEELIALTLRIKKRILAVGRSKGRLGALTLSVNSFVPKAWTPFQFHGFTPVEQLKEKLKYIRRGLAQEANIKVRAGRPDTAYLQAMLARGDRRVGAALGGMIGGRNWRQVCKREGIAPEKYALRMRGRAELFPWEIIETGIDREYLWAEYQRALAGRTTRACDTKVCKRCGVCDGKRDE